MHYLYLVNDETGEKSNRGALNMALKSYLKQPRAELRDSQITLVTP